MRNHFKILTCAVLFACFATNAARANEYPARPIKIVVPYTPGGGTDVVFRIIGQRLSETMGVPVVIENRPGASGTMGANIVAKAQPDGYTLLAYNIAMVTAHHVQKDLPFNAIKDFTPIAHVATVSNTIVVNSGLPVSSLAELVALAKKKPGELNFGSSGIGGPDHMGGELLQIVTGIKLTHVPYKGGGDSNMAAAAGEVQLLAGTIGISGPLVKAGKLRSLVMMQPKRNTDWPDVPSATEAGYPDLVFETWYGLWGPAKMHPDVAQKVNSALKQIMRRDDVSQALARANFDSKYSTPEEFSKLIQNEYGRWNAVLKGKF